MEEIKKNSFIIDIPSFDIGQEATITGIVTKKDKFKDKFAKSHHLGVWIKDITGKILSILESNNSVYQQLKVNDRIRITGQVILNSRNKRVLSNISKIEVLGTLKSDLAELDSEMREHASRMLMSRICRRVATLLQDQHFTPFESRLISNHWNDEGLEPLLVLYPGFGSPAALITSPAAQVIEFLTTALISRAYTVSTCFTSSYRFPNGSSEMLVIVAKATNLDLKEHESLISDISIKILKSEFNMTDPSITKLYGKWPSEIDGIAYLEKDLSCDLNLVNFSANIPVIGKSWNTLIETIIQLFDKDKNILAEGSRERLGDSIISSVTLYPSQFLGLIEKAPRRQLQNVEKIYNGKKLYS